MTKLINILGGPGSGKTATAFSLTFLLQLQGKTVEYIPEVAKGLVWRKEFEKLKDQRKLLHLLYENINYLNGQVDYIILDGPILLGLYYNRHYHGAIFDMELEKELIEKHNEFQNINILLKRNAQLKYQQEGRFQNENDAKEIDVKLSELLNDFNIEHHIVETTLLNANLTNSHVEKISKMV